jgi:hypothetical protein
VSTSAVEFVVVAVPNARRGSMRSSGGRGYSKELAEIINRVLGDMSQEAAARRCEGELSGPTFGRLRSGKVPTEPTIRTFGQWFWDLVCRHYQQEVEADFGRCDAASVSNWLAERCGYLRRPDPVAASDARELTYEPELEDTLLAGFEGVEDLSESDRRTLSVLVKAYIAEKRGRSGG